LRGSCLFSSSIDIAKFLTFLAEDIAVLKE